MVRVPLCDEVALPARRHDIERPTIDNEQPALHVTAAKRDGCKGRGDQQGHEAQEQQDAPPTYAAEGHPWSDTLLPDDRLRFQGERHRAIVRAEWRAVP